MALPNTNITPGSPPLLWSNIDAAFSQINENFDSIAAALGVAGLIPIDFETLDTDVSPTASYLYSLGSSTNRWQSVYTEEWSSVGTSTFNGVWIGTAQIKGISGTVDLPAGSTVNGNLIIDPDKTFFKSAQVDGGDRVEANEFSDTLNFLSGSGITMSVGSPGESITITNDGVITINGIDGITATTLAGITTISNAGVRSLSNIGALPAGRTVGAGIYIDAATGPGIKITNTGIIGFDNSGFGTNVSVDAATGLATVNLSTGVVTTAAFRTIVITGTPGQVNVEADLPSDTLTLNAGNNIIITTDPFSDTINVAVDTNLDIRGSVFANDSSIIVDSVERKFYGDLTGNVRGNLIGSVFADDSTQLVDGNSATIYGNIEATTLRTADTRIVLGFLAGSIGGSGAAITIGPAAGVTNQGTGAMAIGPYAGETNQGTSAMAIGPFAGNTGQGLTTLAVGAYAGQTNQGNVAVAIGAFAGNNSQGTNAIAIGPYSGGTNQGANSIAIGLYAGSLNQSANSIVLNASGVALNGSAAGLYIDPIRSTTSSARPIVYDTATKELFYTSTLEFINSTISTTDSSGLTIDVQTTFNSDVVVENDLTVNNQVLVQGQKVILLNDFKALVAASSNFADFQARIAALA